VLRGHRFGKNTERHHQKEGEKRDEKGREERKKFLSLVKKKDMEKEVGGVNDEVN